MNATSSTGRIVATLGVGVAIALSASSCGGGSDQTQSATETTEPSPSANISLSALGHRPVAGRPWPLVIRAYDAGGQPLAAEVRYQYLFGGAVVARRSHYRFRGTFHDRFTWPERAAGLPLTFRAVVTTPLGTRRLDYPVQVQR